MKDTTLARSMCHLKDTQKKHQVDSSSPFFMLTKMLLLEKKKGCLPPSSRRPIAICPSIHISRPTHNLR